LQCFYNTTHTTVKHLFYVLATAVTLAVIAPTCRAGNDDEQEAQIAMTSQSKRYSRIVSIRLAGTGTATINWGDGTPSDTLPLFKKYVSSKSHRLRRVDSCVITITGGDITLLYCSENNLTALDVSKSPKLKELYCSLNNLTTLDLSKNTKLTELYCSFNDLTSLDVSNNTKLRDLICYYNLLPELDLSKNTKLIGLYCYDNLLTTLDISKNSKLTFLDCSANSLTNLDVRRNTNLVTLDCSRNQFTADELNALFRSLYRRFRKERGQIWIYGNPGSDRCNRSLPSAKQWGIASDRF